MFTLKRMIYNDWMSEDSTQNGHLNCIHFLAWLSGARQFSWTWDFQFCLSQACRQRNIGQSCQIVTLVINSHIHEKKINHSDIMNNSTLAFISSSRDQNE